jgi:hypothetical protein
MRDGRRRPRDIESYSNDPNPAAAHDHPSWRRRVALWAHQPRRKKKTIEEQLEDNRLAINGLYETGQIQIHEGREYIVPAANKECVRLWTQRYELRDQLGPRDLSGMSFHIRSAGVIYSMTPTWDEFGNALEAFNTTTPTPFGPHSQRDRIVRFLFDTRGRGATEVISLPTHGTGGQPVYKSFPRLTKRYLRWRFKMSVRELIRILKAPRRILDLS